MGRVLRHKGSHSLRPSRAGAVVGQSPRSSVRHTWPTDILPVVSWVYHTVSCGSVGRWGTFGFTAGL